MNLCFRFTTINYKMDELNEQIDRLVNLLDVLKSRYFFLRAKHDIGKSIYYKMYLLIS